MQKREILLLQRNEGVKVEDERIYERMERLRKGSVKARYKNGC